MLTQQDATLCDQLDVAATWYDAELRRTPHRSFLIGKAQTCRDIARKVRARDGFVSERQRSYAEALVRWTQPMTPTQQAVAEVQSDRANENAARYNAEQPAATVALAETTLARIIELFAAARNAGLVRPKIRLRTAQGKIVTITLAPSYSRNPGAFYVKVQGPFGNRMLYCGLITPEGVWRPRVAEYVEPVTEALTRFNADPASVATAYGHAMSHCCFCGLGLSDARSVAMGYGPICAGHYRLPWGEERAAQSVTLTREAAVAAIEARSAERERVARQRAMYGLPPSRDALRDSIRARADRATRPSEPATPSSPFRDDEDEHFM